MIRTVAIRGAAVAFCAAAIIAPSTDAWTQAPSQFQVQQFDPRQFQVRQFQTERDQEVSDEQYRTQVQPTAAPEAKSPGQAALQPSPLGGGDWSTDVQRVGPVPGSRLDAGAIATIERINAYFNSIDSLEGRFIQTDPHDKRMRGRFYVQWPGLLRFDYAPPSLMRIVSDGRYLSVEDHDMKTIDKYPLESTPFRMLLRRDVDLLRDAHIVNFVETDKMAVVTVEDKSGEAAGRLMLAFSKGEDSEIEIKEWIITDPQGLDTRIQLGELATGRRMDKDFFAAATIGVRPRD